MLVADLKKVAKTIKGDQELALALYDTGNSDAQYLAGMVVNGARMTKMQLNRWARAAARQLITDYIAKVEARGCIGKKRKSIRC